MGEELEKTRVETDQEYDNDELLSPEEIELQKKIETKEELFEYIDSKLSEDERKMVMNSDFWELHFGFGMWLRNLIIYPGIIDVDYLLLDEDSNAIEIDGVIHLFKIGHPDMESSKLIEAYQVYLRENSKISPQSWGLR